MNIQTILVPVDFSTCSLLVTRQAAGLARQVGARLVLLHVVELPSALNPQTAIDHDGTREAAGAYLTHNVTADMQDYVVAAQELQVEAEVRVAFGQAKAVILKEAAQVHADLIVMGTHGRTGLARMILGSVAESVLHEAHVPVLIVRRETRPECARADCQWCPHKGLSEAEQRVLAEGQG